MGENLLAETKMKSKVGCREIEVEVEDEGKVAERQRTRVGKAAFDERHNKR